MRLSEFIRKNSAQVLSEWEGFARSRDPAGHHLDAVALRDHALTMLTEIARDLDTPKAEREQKAREKGASDSAAPDAEAAGEEHGAGRAAVGFTLDQMVSEFTVLRSTVIGLWRKASSGVSGDDLDDITRFNEAIDQTLTASVSRYVQESDRVRETFLGILGHDLRTPLSTIIMSARLMLETPGLSESHRTVALRIERAGERMNHMVRDLLDFTRSRLGTGIPVDRADVDLEEVIRNAADEVAASNAGRTMNIETKGSLRGEWDARRVSQALANLIGNAVDHGPEGSAIGISASGEADEVAIAVHNEGPPIPKSKLTQLFAPLAHTASSTKGHDPNHLGMGLYIAQAIAVAHGGRIAVESSAERGTTFTVHLPRRG